MEKRAKKNLSRFFATAAAACILAVGCGATVANAATDVSAKGKFYTDFSSFEKEQEYAAKLNRQIMEESVVLMKNNETLPYSSAVKKITLFGVRSYETVLGGAGSGSGGNSESAKTLTESFEAAGYSVNTALAPIYKGNYYTVPNNGVAEVKEPKNVKNLLSVAENSFSLYGDAAIITIGRVGGEGADLATSKVSEHSDPTDHYLQLDDNEKELIEYVKSLKGKYFKSITILVNSANVMELGVFEDDKDIDAIVWMGQPGDYGVMGIGRIFNGEVTPSGHTADIWPANLTADPTWYNFGLNDYHDGSGNNKVYSATAGMLKGQADVQYEEDIYLGYKWYETAAATQANGKSVLLDTTKVGYSDLASGAGADEYSAREAAFKAQSSYVSLSDLDKAYYNRSTGVLYPFGYGLSYTSFTQNVITSASTLKADIQKAVAAGVDGTFEVEVEVKNTGDYAGKDVVQLYVTAPYTAGGIEKAALSLVGFGKTKTLNPGEAEIVKVSVRAEDIASFDYDNRSGKFGAGNGGYIIEAGDYEFKAMANSHVLATAEAGGTAKVTVALDEKVFNSEKDATNVFSKGDEYDTLLVAREQDQNAGAKSTYGSGTMTLMTRNDFLGTYPTYTTQSDRTYNQKVLDVEDRSIVNVNDQTYDTANDPWVKNFDKTKMSGWTQASEEQAKARTDGKTPVQLAAMAGIAITDSAKWDSFLNQLTWEELCSLTSYGRHGTTSLPAIGKKATQDEDGPGKLKGGTFWCCETNIASTWNVELAYEEGLCVGNESLFLNETGWYGPAANTHRSAFSGRNFEYYSQDAVHAGYMGAKVVEGAMEKGVLVYVKHYAINDQETDRMSVNTWASEQTLRENYLKAFEIIFKNGGASACMSSFNKVGAWSASSNYRLLTTVLRDEWGFEGLVATDAYSENVQGKAGAMHRSGGDIPLAFSFNTPIAGKWDAAKNTVVDGEGKEWAIQWYYIRQSAKNLLFACANSSNIQNGMDTVSFADPVSFDIPVGYVIGGNEISMKNNPATYTFYEVTAGTLPDGITLDSSTGAFSGTTNEEAGKTFVITVTMKADGWVQEQKTVTLNVVDAFGRFKGVEGIKAGDKVNGNLDYVLYLWNDDDIVRGQYAYVGVKFTAISGLPEGLTLNEDGTLTGTAPAEGTYEFNVGVEIEYHRRGAGSGQIFVNDPILTTRTFVLTVGGENAGIKLKDNSVVPTPDPDPTPTPTPTPDPVTPDNSTTNSGAVLGGIGIGVGALALIGTAALWFVTKKRA